MLERHLMLKRDLNEPERDLILSEIKWADFVSRNISRSHFVPRSRSLQRSLFQTRSPILMRLRVEERSRNQIRSLLYRGTKSAHFVSHPSRDFRTWVVARSSHERHSDVNCCAPLRYNAERFVNGDPLVKALELEQPVAEAYFPRMLSLHQSRGYPGRQANTSLLVSAL